MSFRKEHDWGVREQCHISAIVTVDLEDCHRWIVSAYMFILGITLCIDKTNQEPAHFTAPSLSTHVCPPHCTCRQVYTVVTEPSSHVTQCAKRKSRLRSLDQLLKLK